MSDKKPTCWCYNCNKGKPSPYGGSLPYELTVFITCPACGNKRCPHATDHNLECTNSNEPGQPGSRY